MPINLNGNIISSTDITSVGVFKSKVNRDGLLCYLDAGNINSYAGTSNIWYDLSGNNRNAIIQGSVIYGATYGGYFETPANQVATYIELPESAPQNLSNGLIFTIDWWCTMKDNSFTRYMMSMVDSAGGNRHIIAKNVGDFSVYGVSLQTGANPTYTVDVPVHLVITSDGNTQFFYKNGVLASVWGAPYADITTTTGFIIDQEQDASKGGFDPTQNTYGWWHIVRMYNRALNPYEIAENFQSERGRFGI